ncbi:hypothetical protein [Planctomycetes bacterium K23_9]|uniref:Uncharacterized protein n=1 Tax=Stieleria marina TaxID=1930275 RepID=A0A517NR93_9BACT|nr:hypothetical protein K239x_15730 [Planctomycetes bacterium K23_9]
MNTRQTSVRPTANFQWLLTGLVGLLVSGESSAAEVCVSVDGHTQADGCIENTIGATHDAVRAARALHAAGNCDSAVIDLLPAGWVDNWQEATGVPGGTACKNEGKETHGQPKCLLT